jgi:hypothetical protein
MTALARVVIVAVGLLASAVVAPPGLAAGVKSAPKPGGSLERTFRHCTHERDFDLVTTTCQYSYFVDPPFSDDPQTYSVAWTQVAVEARKGWCFAGARGSISQPGSRITDWVADPPFTVGLNLARLRVESRGRTLGGVVQRFRLSHGAISARVDRHPRGDQYSWRWRGRSPEKVVLVIGVGFARTPSDQFVLSDEGTVFGSVRC